MTPQRTGQSTFPILEGSNAHAQFRAELSLREAVHRSVLNLRDVVLPANIQNRLLSTVRLSENPYLLLNRISLPFHVWPFLGPD